MQPLYYYNAIIKNVVDGDTVDAEVDLGFSVFMNVRFRLYGIDTPEKTSKDPAVRALAVEATKYVTEFLLNKPVKIWSVEKDKYGRWLGKIFTLNTKTSINEELIQHGYAKDYFGGNKQGLNWSEP